MCALNITSFRFLVSSGLLHHFTLKSFALHQRSPKCVWLKEHVNAFLVCAAVCLRESLHRKVSDSWETVLEKLSLYKESETQVLHHTQLKRKIKLIHKKNADRAIS